MALNFEKAVALTTLEKTGTDKFKLKDTQFGEILNQINNSRYTEAYGSALQAVDVSAGTTTYTKNMGGTISPKTAIGGGTPAVMRLSSVTVAMNKHFFMNEGITKIDINKGLSQAMAKKLVLFAAQLEVQNQEDAFTTIKSDTVSTVKLDYNAADMTAAKAEDFRNFIVEEALKMLRFIDKDQAIIRVRRDQLIIDLSPEAFNLAIKGAVIGDLASAVVREGVFSFVTLGGFKVRMNPYLDAGTAIGEMPVIITTNYAFKTPMAMTAANIDRLLPSNDMAVYTETNYGSGFVYDKVMKKVILK